MDQPKPSLPDTRSLIYRLLASLYAIELNEENIVDFQNGHGCNLLDTLEKVGAYAPAITFLKKYFAKITDPKKAALNLAESYAWNFHGVGGPHASPLYASVYLSAKGSTHQEVERELHQTLLVHGLSAVNYKREPCDHLSVILEFISWLSGQEGSSQQQAEWQNTQCRIIEKFLLTWLSKFVTQCKRGDRLGFYSALAEKTLAFVEKDFKQIC